MTDSTAIASVADTTTLTSAAAATIAAELRQPLAEQDAALTAVLDLQTALCARVDALAERLQSAPRVFDNVHVVATYMQKITVCHSRLVAVHRRLDAVTQRVAAAERLVVAPL